MGFAPMAWKLRIATAVALGGVFVWAPGADPLAARHADSEADLTARIERESSPVRKAKYEIRLGRVRLLEAVAACEKDQHENCQHFLDGYVEAMKTSWQTLKDSGRPAEKKPQGFKELDIALREDGRIMGDLRRRIPFQDREMVEKAEREAEQIRSEVLEALFPGGRLRERQKKAVHGDECRSNLISLCIRLGSHGEC